MQAKQNLVYQPEAAAGCCLEAVLPTPYVHLDDSTLTDCHISTEGRGCSHACNLALSTLCTDYMMMTLGMDSAGAFVACRNLLRSVVVSIHSRSVSTTAINIRLDIMNILQDGEHTTVMVCVSQQQLTCTALCGRPTWSKQDQSFIFVLHEYHRSVLTC